MPMNTKQIVEKIGATDQLFLAGNRPELALERADLRLQLVQLSKVRQEQVYFLQEAIVLLEQGRIEFEDMPWQLYLDLSLQLAKAYMIFFELSHETRYALITQQILKPFSKAENGDVLFFLAYTCSVKNEPALCRHWLKKYSLSTTFDPQLIQFHPAFREYYEETWFQHILRQNKIQS